MTTDTWYPAGPTDVPEDLTRPTRGYRLRALVAVAGLLGFVAVYLALIVWFARQTVHLLTVAVRPEGGLWLFVGSAGSAFLTLFLVKALWFVKRGGGDRDVEITRADEPRLFEFLDRLAAEVGTSRAHRVFLSNQVNAAVFYDLSVLNLIVPTKKNLLIGLPLVNALTLSEFKAVLAHEFGHFAQRTMQVGRWVYLGHQIAAHIVSRRDAFDRFLVSLSGFDLRVAWIGWLLRLVVWSLRAFVDTLFRVVVLADRALSREMEFQADRTAVALTGSDAIIHALLRLGAADDAWDRTVRFAASELGSGRRIPDGFDLQTRFVEQIRRIRNDDTHGQPPPIPELDRAGHRVFEAGIAEPPRMWSTHPPNHEREESAKARYVESIPDDRPAWGLFADPALLRQRMTERLLDAIRDTRDSSTSQPDDNATRLTREDALARVDEVFACTVYERKYRGAYLRPWLVRRAPTAEDLYGELPPPDAVRSTLETLYPEDLADDLERLEALESERDALKALRDGILTAPGGVIRHRGRQLRRRKLPAAIAKVGDELEQVRERIWRHDVRCRTAHLAAARELGRGWDAYLGGLGTLLHYAEHGHADLADAAGKLSNEFEVAIADGKVSGRERARLIKAASDLHITLWGLFRQRSEVVLPEPVAARLGVESWTDALPDSLGLPEPDEDSLGDWLDASGGWVNATAGPFEFLRDVTLEVLLEAEAHVDRCLSEGIEPDDAPAPARVPRIYETLLEGEERKRHEKLGLWDRFQLADGWIPGLARFALATVVLGTVVVFGAGPDEDAKVAIYNGLTVPVEVTIGDLDVLVLGQRAAVVETPEDGEVEIVTTVVGGSREIESFRADLSSRATAYVYNVARAAPLVEWTAIYGHHPEVPDRPLGTARWTTTDAEVLFVEPPSRISTSSGRGTVVVLSAIDEEDPRDILETIPEEDPQVAAIRAHARWDRTDRGPILTWLALARGLPDFSSLLALRLEEDPDDVVLLRFEQDTAPDGAVCDRHRRQAAERPDDLDWHYLAIRCMENEEDRDRAFVAAFRDNPRHGWLAAAAAYAFLGRAEWESALETVVLARSQLPILDPTFGEVHSRLFRIVHGEIAVPSVAPIPRSIARLMQLEAGLGEGALASLGHLAAGDVRAAVDLAATDKDLYPYVLRLAAASDGADPDLVALARSLPDDAGIDGTTIWTAIAWGRRQGLDVDALEDLVRRRIPEVADAMLWFADEETLRSEPDLALPAFAKTDLQARGQARMMGLLTLGDDAPASWRVEAKAFLFASERPYLE